MVPPSPLTNFKPGSLKPNFSNRPHATPISSVRIDYGRPQEMQEAPLLRPDKRPSEIHLIKRPDGSGSSGQGHVHTEILVHHKPETINVRPQSALHPSVHSHVHSIHQTPVHGHFLNGQNPMEQIPPRRAEFSTPAEIPHRYILPGKPDSGNEITLSTNWKSDKKPNRFVINRSRPRPISRSTTKRPLDRHVIVERPVAHPPIRKPTYPGPQRPPIKTQNVFTLSHRPSISQIPQESTRIPPKLFALQIDHQNRPPYVYPDKMSASNFAASNTPTEQNDYVPTGAIEYHNPLHLNPILEENKHSHVSTMRPQYTSSEDNSKKWQINAQLEQTLLDSDIGASEYVNYQNHYYKQGNKKQDTNATINTAMYSSQDTNQTLKLQTLYGPIVSINTVVGKPLEVQQEYTTGTDGKLLLLQKPYEIDPYNTRPYDLPIIQGKPFGVYNGHVDPITISYGYKRKEDKPVHEIVHGTYVSDNKNIKPTSIAKTRDEHTTTSNLLERDDIIDLKPPAITLQFATETDKPGRPYHRPIRPDTRPIIYRKPETATKAPVKLEVKPDYIVKSPSSHKPNTAETFINQTLDHKIKTNHDIHDWNVDVITSDIVKSQQKLSTGHTYEINTQIIQNKNSTASRPIMIGNNRLNVIRPEHGTFTRVHPEYPHILTKPKPQVPKPVIVSSGSTGLETHNRPNIKFSMPVEITGEEVDSKTQTERPPSMLIIKNNLSHSKVNNATLNTAYQANSASVESQNKQDEIKIRPVNTKENVPSRNMMPPPLNAGSGQSNRNEQEGLKPPPPPSDDVLGLSPPPVDITTTHTPLEDRFAVITTSESGLKPPKYIPLKESTTLTASLPSTNMVPPSPRPSFTRPFLVELLSQVRLQVY